MNRTDLRRAINGRTMAILPPKQTGFYKKQQFRRTVSFQIGAEMIISYVKYTGTFLWRHLVANRINWIACSQESACPNPAQRLESIVGLRLEPTRKGKRGQDAAYGIMELCRVGRKYFFYYISTSEPEHCEGLQLRWHSCFSHIAPCRSWSGRCRREEQRVGWAPVISMPGPEASSCLARNMEKIWK